MTQSPTPDAPEALALVKRALTAASVLSGHGYTSDVEAVTALVKAYGAALASAAATPPPALAVAIREAIVGKHMEQPNPNRFCYGGTIDADKIAAAVVAATPAPARLDAAAMRELVEKWREEGRGLAGIANQHDDDVAHGKACGLMEAADALEAALSPQERADG